MLISKAERARVRDRDKVQNKQNVLHVFNISAKTALVIKKGDIIPSLFAI
jgi:hypothetical protein